MEVKTKRIRFVNADGGHEGLINASDFDPARHIPLDEPEATSKPGKPEKPTRDETDLDETPGGISTVNSNAALALIAEADTAEELDTLENAERASQRHPGGRKGVLKAIEARREELA
jgi:hypothetical protein